MKAILPRWRWAKRPKEELGLNCQRQTVSEQGVPLGPLDCLQLLGGSPRPRRHSWTRSTNANGSPRQGRMRTDAAELNIRVAEVAFTAVHDAVPELPLGRFERLADGVRLVEAVKSQPQASQARPRRGRGRGSRTAQTTRPAKEHSDDRAPLRNAACRRRALSGDRSPASQRWRPVSSVRYRAPFRFATLCRSVCPPRRTVAQRCVRGHAPTSPGGFPIAAPCSPPSCIRYRPDGFYCSSTARPAHGASNLSAPAARAENRCATRQPT